MRYFLRIRYHGGHFHGWQIQPNAITVQQVVNQILSEMTRTEIETTGCGRTDTGVHADDFYLHFDTSEPLKDAADLLFRLKARTVRGIQFRELFPVKPEVHARFSATERSYVYRISQERNPFQDGLVLFMKRFPDVDLMNQAAGYLIGKHDFECFSKSNSQVNSYICDVRSAEWVVHNTLLEFRISADRFLRNMVRAIVGTMLEIGEKKRSPEWMEEVISSGKRSEAGSSAEACGLYLTRVVYPNNIEL